MDHVVLDVSNLLYRHFYGARGVAWADRPFAALHEFCRDVGKYADRFGTESILFAFDAPPYKRRGVFSGYKNKADTRADEEEQAARDELASLTKSLGSKLLTAAGFTSVHARLGYEADDIMAAVREGMPPDDRCILVTGDQDVYQLLDARCAVYHPINDNFVTARVFKAAKSIRPVQWVELKALTGCDSDKIPGCPGVAEKTALKYLLGQLPTTHKIHSAITEYLSGEDYARNLQLVKLPYSGLPPVVPAAPVPLGQVDWRPLADRIGVPVSALSETYSRRAVRTG